MFPALLLAGSALALIAAITPARADQAFPATLAGHAMIPAATSIQAPADAPAERKSVIVRIACGCVAGGPAAGASGGGSVFSRSAQLLAGQCLLSGGSVFS